MRCKWCFYDPDDSYYFESTRHTVARYGLWADLVAFIMAVILFIVGIWVPNVNVQVQIFSTAGALLASSAVTAIIFGFMRL